MKTSSLLRRAVAAGAVTASLALAGPPASAALPTRDNNCVHPSGVSLNELFGVPEQFVAPICEGLTAGEHWRPIMNYFGADGSDAVYPPGYVPLHANPVDDILAKVTIEVMDRGASRQKTYTFSPRDEDSFARMSGSTSSTRRFPTSRRSSSCPAWRRSAWVTTPTSSSGCSPLRTATEPALTKAPAASPPASSRSLVPTP